MDRHSRYFILTRLVGSRQKEVEAARQRLLQRDPRGRGVGLPGRISPGQPVFDIAAIEAFDEAWKVDAEGDVGAYWGLWDKDGNLKYV